MTPLLLLAVLVLVPILAIVLLRVNGAIAYMSLCVGSVLVSYTAGDVNAVVSSTAAAHTVQNQWVKIALLTIPFVLSILFTRASINGPKKLTNLFPALASGLLFRIAANAAVISQPAAPDTNSTSLATAE